MTRTFIETSIFTKQWRDLGFDEDDLRAIQNQILENPKIGDVVPGTGRLRKMRFAFENRGKSGSSRVCYVDFAIYETIYLMTVYQKKDKDNLTRRECNDIKNAIDSIERELGRKKMSELYEDLMAGFNEIHESLQNKKELKTTTLTIPDVKHYSDIEIKQIRQKTGMTQALFAYYMGVSKKTVEAWEHGTNHPTGPACRILYYLETGEMVKVP